ncbi:MAG: UDP-N-acetylmuramoyl-L-alanine--D-glutamate ligase, partial [Gemmatimonadetes bacterium]|nr:UDP-N-acetylmuramoyl-L-alanine--D-glutamate ligase [Gemmatimonadota bacterium]
MNRTRSRGPALNGATAVVLGYGRSGKAAAALLAREGARPRVTDTKDATALAVAPGSVPGGDAWLGRMDEAVLAGADLVIASPGVPPTNPVLAAALRAGLPVHSELELGWWHVDAPTVAITGTNGKSSTREMIARVLAPLGPVVQSEKSFNNDLGVPL